ISPYSKLGSVLLCRLGSAGPRARTKVPLIYIELKDEGSVDFSHHNDVPERIYLFRGFLLDPSLYFFLGKSGIGGGLYSNALGGGCFDPIVGVNVGRSECNGLITIVPVAAHHWTYRYGL